MSTHLENLQRNMGLLLGLRVLDLGAGDGDFLVQCAQQGIRAVGIETSQEKIDAAYERAHRNGVTIDVRRGNAEHVPLPSASFDFINASELIEHVQNPDAVLREIARLLAPGGRCYMSVHNRFGLIDRHFKMRFLGWMPRHWAERYLTWRGVDKAEYDGRFGVQRLSEMHYFTWGQFNTLSAFTKLRATDMRENSVNKKGGKLAVLFYQAVFRPVYFSTFHAILTQAGRENLKDTTFYNRESDSYSKKRYSNRAENYTQFFFMRRLQLVLNELEQWVKGRKGMRMMDIGCADGVVTRSLETALGNSLAGITGIDIAEKMIERAKSLDTNGLARYYVRGTEPEGVHYDLIVETGVINFVDDFSCELAFTRGRLTEGGLYVVSIAGRSSMHARHVDISEQYSHLLTYEEYELMICDQFRIRTCIPCGLHLPIIWKFPALARTIQPIMEWLLSPWPHLFNENIFFLIPKSSEKH